MAGAELRYLRPVPRKPGFAAALIACAPWLTVAVAAAMLFLLDRELCRPSGMSVDLPSTRIGDCVAADMVMLLIPSTGGTLAFFDDMRYHINEPCSLSRLEEELASAVSRRKSAVLLVLADKDVSSGELMTLADAAGRAGVDKVMFAEKERRKDG